ncbi:hypothetical protein SAMN05421753_112163 [Planctomicrobium piriforme]|uniref:Uncharacterized protein n=1 Tax=Planctomicrobium piriforme TaxID=1576369 RepID=A0A1I3L7E5_9PLAN|nr:hypothetical protein SAMN05421753_112163 [Planctomicrobium piriforme]
MAVILLIALMSNRQPSMQQSSSVRSTSAQTVSNRNAQTQRGPLRRLVGRMRN